MLYLKEDTKFEDLQKFGFMKAPVFSGSKYFVIPEEECMISIDNDNRIRIWFKPPFSEKVFQLWNNLSFELISAGIVEKVDNERKR